MSEPSILYLFTYGTLRQHSPHPWAEFLRDHALDLGVGSFPGTLYDLGHYPGAVFDPAATTRVHGNIYQLRDPASVLAKLDNYEGFGEGFESPFEFVRELIPVTTDRGTLPCWVYTYHWSIDQAEVIESGRYLE